jgi:uncharacterized protein YcbK (DUF882 family)
MDPDKNGSRLHDRRLSGERRCGWKKPDEDKPDDNKPDDDGTGDFMTDTARTGFSRRSLLGIFAATAVTAAPIFNGAPAYARNAGNIRRLRLYSGRTGERLDAIYWIQGSYIPESLQAINHFMRDWRNNRSAAIDRRTIDIMAATYRLLDADAPYMMLSGYRSPETNAMLRSRSSAVASNSLHMRGQAADLRLEGRTVDQIARAAAACRAGGVGRYSRSNFVHIDCGDVRNWGR